MSISSEINRINANVAGAYSAAQSMGAAMPGAQNSANLRNTILSIPQEGGGGMGAGWIELDRQVAVGGSAMDLELTVPDWTSYAQLIVIVCLKPYEYYVSDTFSLTVGTGYDYDYYYASNWSDPMTASVVSYFSVHEGGIYEEYASRFQITITPDLEHGMIGMESVGAVSDYQHRSYVLPRANGACVLSHTGEAVTPDPVIVFSTMGSGLSDGSEAILYGIPKG